MPGLDAEREFNTEIFSVQSSQSLIILLIMVYSNPSVIVLIFL